MKAPPRILHAGKRPKYYIEMVQSCSSNLRLSKAESSLLLFYCDQANHFRPALRLISRATGIQRNRISTVRKELVRRSLIGYDGNIISIDWYRIRSFAIIDPLTKQESLYGTFSKLPPVEPTLGELARKYRDADAIDWKNLGYEPAPRTYTSQEERWIYKIEHLTERKYLRLMDLIRESMGLPRIDEPIVMYPKNEIQKRTFESAKEIFRYHGYDLSDEELVEFDWRSPFELEDALRDSTTLDEVRSKLRTQDDSDFLFGVL